MTAVSVSLEVATRRRERLSNWLALLALLAGGVVFQDAHESTAAASGKVAYGPATSGPAASGAAASGATPARTGSATPSAPVIATRSAATCYR